MRPDLRPDGRQRLGEREQAFELDSLSNLTECRMIAILFASLRVSACRLNVSLRGRTNPDVRPSRGHRERSQPANNLRAGNPGAVWLEINEPLADLLASNPRRVVRYVTQ